MHLALPPCLCPADPAQIELAALPAYMELVQTDVTWSMRSLLMDWVVQVHKRFQLLPETLFVAVNYIDRFLSLKAVSVAKLQLVGATALFLAAKFEEINCPSIEELLYMVDNTYSAPEVLKAEKYMMTTLRFQLAWPGPMSFLRRISRADDYDLDTRTIAKYFLDVAVMDHRFVSALPSLVAAAAYCLARYVLAKGHWVRRPCHQAARNACTNTICHTRTGPTSTTRDGASPSSARCCRC